MTDEQINQRIAEACGWKPKRQTKLTRTGHFKVSYENPPEYCSDLNAMHEAEKVLGNRLGAYGELLCEMTVVSERDFAECYIWHATARQRAEAFLRTLGKWEEVQG